MTKEQLKNMIVAAVNSAEGTQLPQLTVRREFRTTEDDIVAALKECVTEKLITELEYLLPDNRSGYMYFPVGTMFGFSLEADLERIPVPPVSTGNLNPSDTSVPTHGDYVRGARFTYTAGADKSEGGIQASGRETKTDGKD